MKTFFAALLLSASISACHAETMQISFTDPMFQRCVTWLLTGNRGNAMIEHVCSEDYSIPAPSLVLCAQKLQTGFMSKNDQDMCAIVFEMATQRIKDGFIR